MQLMVIKMCTGFRDVKIPLEVYSDLHYSFVAIILCAYSTSRTRVLSRAIRWKLVDPNPLILHVVHTAETVQTFV